MITRQFVTIQPSEEQGKLSTATDLRGYWDDSMEQYGQHIWAQLDQGLLERDGYLDKNRWRYTLDLDGFYDHGDYLEGLQVTRFFGGPWDGETWDMVRLAELMGADSEFFIVPYQVKTRATHMMADAVYGRHNVPGGYAYLLDRYDTDFPVLL